VYREGDEIHYILMSRDAIIGLVLLITPFHAGCPLFL
jgi:hypothetical protein